MQLITKLNISLTVSFLIASAIASWVHYQVIEQNSFRQISDQAELVLEQINALRSYTVSEVRPLTELDSNSDKNFHPQSVPAYAATQVANLLSKGRPEYSYKEAVFNPTNFRDDAAPWEERIIEQFIEDESIEKLMGTRRVEGVRSLYIAKPIQISNPACLECHSVPEAAPKAMVAKYGNKNGFNWKLNEIVGTQLVIVPYTLPAELAGDAFNSFIISLILIFLAMIISLNVSYQLIKRSWSKANSKK